LPSQSIDRIHSIIVIFWGAKKQYTMAIKRLLAACVASITFAGLASAHGGGVAHQKPIQIDPEADWGTRHMAGTLPLHPKVQLDTDLQKRNIISRRLIRNRSSHYTIMMIMDPGTRAKY
jgi:hypothetical protein